MNKESKFVILEGPGRSGKTTQMGYIENLLTGSGMEKGKDFVVTREPGGVPESEEIRKLIFYLVGENLIGPEGQTTLYFTARKFWLEKLVEPSLEKGMTVITDRCDTTTAAFQGYGEGGDMNQISGFSKAIMGKLKADAVILLDIDLETMMQRNVDDETDPFDKKGPDFQQRVIDGYREMAENSWGGMKWYTIDGRKSKEEVSKEIKEVLEEILGKKLHD